MPETQPPDLSLIWKRLEMWCASHLPELLDDLNPGTSIDEIAAFEQTIGHPLPEDVRGSYLIHNGQRTSKPTGLFFGLPLLSLADAERFWKEWREIDPDNDELKTFAESLPEGAVRLDYTCPGWIPLSQDWGGNHLGIDLSPGPKGTVGQVIVFGTDEDTKYVTAPTWAAFLDDIATKLEAGDFRIDETKDLAVGDPDISHYHDYLAEVAQTRQSAPP